MKEKIIVSSLSLVTSLACYQYAKTHQKDVVVGLLIGGFIGAMVGETIVYLTTKKNSN
jgi:ethanolamine transporter EutH